ncbi:endonuclease domain-containing protein [Salsipaludibacter albus]|uniref:endonuclease domain-containing protein n=1 Tax=Salsipaludibacter albus TaxID=2849650 RepID=UPI001EE4E33B|nr:endonuclease domain-containing protein [Salsipaludibacter albus]MBY5162314.1 endonuclease domain-containing protein [Salsipaludibacter albus]
MTTMLQSARSRVLDDLGLDASSSFTWTGVEREGNEVSLHWDLDGVGRLTERLVFHGVSLDGTGVRRTAIDRSLRLLHLVAGVSYLKTTLPPDLRTGPISPAVRDLLAAITTDGLAELAWDHDVDLRGHFTFPEPATAPEAAVPIGATAGPLVPIGGGKDSIVTLDAVADHEPTLFAVNPRGPILRTFEAAGHPTVTVDRHLDPELFALNDRGAVNGHVPVTAIVSAIAVVAAVAGGHSAVLLSNERSADQATVVTDDGRAINHQWSKSSAFERAFARIVADEVAPDVTYLSLLRPASELWIARRFSELGSWDTVFNSCNRAFHLQGQRREWCGHCPKCRFVFLALAPFMGRDRVVGILGRDLLDDPDQVDDYAALAGLTDHKPFECVGEAEESAAALASLAADPDWADDAVVAALADRLPVGPDALESFLATPDTSALPAPWDQVL